MLKLHCSNCGCEIGSFSMPCPECGYAERCIVCPECEQKIPEKSDTCPICGFPMAQQASANPPTTQAVIEIPLLDKSRLVPLIIAIIAALLILIGCIWGISCACSACEEAEEDYEPSYTYADYTDTMETLGTIYLKVSDVRTSYSGSYVKATGRVTNNGTVTYEFVKVKGAFVDSRGNTVDTDWTYAVGSEGLAPGESCTFTMYVDKDYSISDCKVTVYDCSVA